jgi:hypothetical protein
MNSQKSLDSLERANRYFVGRPKMRTDAFLAKIKAFF